MNSSAKPEYLTYEEQQRIVNILATEIRKAPLTRRLYVEHGPNLAAMIMASSSLYLWRTSYRAFGLYKYGMNRISSLALALVPTTMIARAIHSTYVKEHLMAAFRNECGLCYGVRSLLCHQIAILYSGVTIFGGCFYFAYANGIMVIPDKFYVDSESRNITRKYLFKNFKPHVRGVLTTVAMSSFAMLLVGIGEYQQSLNLLKKVSIDGIALPKAPRIT